VIKRLIGVAKALGNRDLECDGSTVLSKLVGGKKSPAVGRVFALPGGDGKKIRDCRLQPSHATAVAAAAQVLRGSNRGWGSSGPVAACPPAYSLAEYST